MILAGNAGVIGNAIREIFGLLDKAVYWVLVNIVNLLTDIARTNVLTESTIQTFANRIYFIMGTIMFFKMAVSIITYIVDPDKLTDSKTGFASIIKNTVIALVMVVAVPIVFRYAMFAQEAILQDDTIGRLITGKTGGTQNNVGDTVATNILSGFIHPDEDIVGGECNNLGYSEECKTKLATYSADLALTYSYIDPTVRTSQGVPGSKYGYAHLIDLGTANDVHKTGGAKDYVIDYKIVLSTLAGGFAVYIFLLSCFDVAVRTVKFAFLQIIAPIPIATYIDEKGKTMFNNWRKACVSTYVDLFVRLAAVQFGIFMITEFVGDLANHGICSTQIQNGQIITGACRRPGIFVELFIIFGILLFIKEVPKLVEQITGIKLNGKFEFSPMKRMTSIPGVGNLTARTVGGIDSAIAGRGFKNGWKTGGKAVPFFAGGAKTLSDLTPHRAEMLKNRQTGREELKYRREKESDGEKLYHDYRNAIESGQDIDKDEYLISKFKHSEFKESYRKMGAAKSNMYKKQNDLAQAQAELNAAMSSGDAERVSAARSAYDKAKKAEGTATSQYEIAKADHESMRKIYSDDATKQDMFDYIDKTRPASKPTNTASSASTSSTSSSTSTSTSQSSSQASSTTSTTSSTTSTGSQTVGGVSVSGPAGGERTTASGIIIPGSVRNDK